MVSISIIVPPKVESTIQCANPDHDMYQGPLVLEETLRQNGFEDVKVYDQSLRYNGMPVTLFDYDGPDFEENAMIGLVDECVERCAATTQDSDVYMISTHLANHTTGIKLAQELKRQHRNGDRKKKGYIIIGGPSVAETTERILAIDEIDVACYGHGEETAPMLVKAVADTEEDISIDTLARIPNLYFRAADGSYQTTEFKTPDNFVSVPREKIASEVERLSASRVDIVGAYGCDWGQCSYCYLSAKPHHYKKRPIEDIVADVEAASRIPGVRTVEVLDEAFLYRALNFLELLNPEKAPREFVFNTRPNHVIARERELDEFIRKYPGRIIGVQTGIESFDPAEVERLNRGVSGDETRKSLRITTKLMERYNRDQKVRFHNDPALFLWANGRSKEWILDEIFRWEKYTKGAVSAADLTKVQRYNRFSIPEFAEETRRMFDNDLDAEQRKLAVTYPYGRAIFHNPLRDLYDGIQTIMMTLGSEHIADQPLGPHQLHMIRSALLDNNVRGLNKYGRRILDFPVSSLIIGNLKGLDDDSMAKVIHDIGQLYNWVLQGKQVDIDRYTHMRVTEGVDFKLMKQITHWVK
jgi:hypothetical protein